MTAYVHHWFPTASFGATVLRIGLIVGGLLLAGRGNAQAVSFNTPESEEEAYSLFSSKDWLETAAVPANFILIQHTQISRIVTLHRKAAQEQLPISITVVNRTGEFALGTWEAQIQEIPEAPGLVYCIFEVDKNAPPGRYEVRSSAPESWINAAGTEKKGMVWVLMKKKAVL